MGTGEERFVGYTTILLSTSHLYSIGLWDLAACFWKDKKQTPASGQNSTHLMDVTFSGLSNGAENRLGDEDFVAGERGFVVQGQTLRKVNELVGTRQTQECVESPRVLGRTNTAVTRYLDWKRPCVLHRMCRALLVAYTPYVPGIIHVRRWLYVDNLRVS